MNRKIPFQELAAALAEKTGARREEAEGDVKGFFELIASELTEGKTVTVPGLGTFAPTGDENGVSFTPDPELAEALNAPFALFEPEEVSDDITEETLAEAVTPKEEEKAPEEEKTPEPTPEPTAEPAPAPTPAPAPEKAPEKAPEPTPEPSDGSENSDSSDDTPSPEPSENSEPSDSTPAPKPTPTPTPIPATAPIPVAPVFKPIEEDEEEHITAEESERGGLGFGWGFVVGIIVGLALGACGVYFALDYIYPTGRTIETEESEMVEELLAPADTVAADTVAEQATEPAPAPETPVSTETTEAPAPAAEVAETPAPAPAPEAAKPVYDTIKAGYLLQAMARKHYGHKIYWVYIYEENKNQIGNPNKLQAGMKVVIPPASKYGIDSSASALKKAEEKEAQILKKYPN